jgi:hypothetical protein
MTAPSPHRYTAIDARVSTEDQGKGFFIPTQQEDCQLVAARFPETGQTPAPHVVLSVSRGHAR